MPVYSIHQVDAFTTRPLEGNPCAVVFDCADLSDDVMLAKFCYTRIMVDLEQRLRRAFSSMAANESLADALDEHAAATMLKWGEVIARQFVLKTSRMEEDAAAAEFLAPYSTALRKMMRALGHWAVETDQEVREEWWNRIEQNGKTLYGDRFVLPRMEIVMAQLPPHRTSISCHD